MIIYSHMAIIYALQTTLWLPVFGQTAFHIAK